MQTEDTSIKTVRCRNPHNGVVYVYSYELYFDEQQGKHRQRRRCVGKVDPISGEVVPTTPRGASQKKPSSGHADTSVDKKEKAEARDDGPDMLRQIEELKSRNKELELQLTASQREVAQLRASRDRLVRAIEAALEKS